MPAFSLLFIGALLARPGDGDRQDYDHAARDQLLAKFESHQDEAIVNQPDHERAHDGSDDRTEASEQARAPSTAAAMTESSSPSPSWKRPDLRRPA